MIDRTCVLLLAGGDKPRQPADIERAVSYLNDYKKRTASL
jgi:putative component of toxin-antitoxin plasmid stabilization module